jgi:hypothetical protein
MGYLNWDSLPIKWSSSYGGTVHQRVFSGQPVINCSSTEPILSGIIQPMTLSCQEDMDSLDNLFLAGEKLIRCPIFYQCPIVIEDVTSYYYAPTKSIRWLNSPYSFSGGYYVGTNADSNFNVINPLLPVEWKVKIVPNERGYEFTQTKAGQKRKCGAIPFKVLNRVQPL